MTGDRVRLQAGSLALEVAPAVGGSIAAYTDAGRPLMRATRNDYGDVLEAACFPLVPYSNRVRDGRFSFRGREVELQRNNLPQRHPLHGVGWRGVWTVVAQEAHAATLAFDWPGGDWPWPFRAEQTFALDDEGLSIVLSVENRGGDAMPAGLGLHPYFPNPPGTRLDASVDEVWTVDADLFPDGVTSAVGRYSLGDRHISRAGLDHGFGGWRGLATIRWPTGGGVRLSAAERFFQVYAPPDQDVLCAEPVSHANGALNAAEEAWPALGLRVLAPGERLTLTARFDPLRP